MVQVLIVDDSRAVRADISTFLEEQGITVLEACDGEEGIQVLNSDSDIKLLISDVNMPVMDGLTMVENIRADSKNDDLAILMLTTENNPRMIKRARAAKITGWIVKPFNGPAALDSIKKLIGL